MNSTIFPPFVSFIPASALIAVVSTLHVAASHFAVGGGLLLYLEERRALKEGDTELLSWLKIASKILMYIFMVFGTSSGMALWLIAGMISPLAATYMVVNFTWIWMTAWAFLVLQASSILFYVSTWDSAPPKLHRRIGLLYFSSALLNLFFINGILSFQLTPSKIREPLNLFKAFFNHTSFPGILARSFMSVWLASLFFLFFLAFYKDCPFRITLAKRLSRVSIYALFLIPAGVVWYGVQTSKASLENFGRVPYLQGLMFSALLLFLVGISLTFFLSVLFPQLYRPLSASLPLVCAVLAFGFCEWTREDLRLPYLVKGAVYANDLDVRRCRDYGEGGFKSEAGFLRLAGEDGGGKLKGRLLFAKLCAPCHTISGINRLDRVFSRIDDEFASALVRKSTFVKAPMPPFPAGDDEARLLSAHITSSAKRLPPHEKGKDVFGVRCGPCHDWDRGYRTLKSDFRGKGEKEAFDMIGSLGSITESMPDWSGSEEERRALASYLSAGSKGGQEK